MIIRLLLMAIGIAGIILFFIPIAKRGVANTGNVIGLIFSVLVLMFGSFSWLFSLTFKIVLCVIVLLLIILIVIENILMSKASHIEPKDASVVLVLGCKCVSDDVNEALNQRIRVACRYLDKHPAATCIACGGRGGDLYESEAEYIATELSKYGINRSRILLEDKSKNTYQNMYNARQIIDEKNLDRKVAIATNEYHQYRANFFARRVDLKPSAISAHSVKYMYPTYFVREIIAIVVAWIKRK